MTITAESATDYVRTLFSGPAYSELTGITVDSVTSNNLDGEPAFDVDFRYSDMRGLVQSGCMTVWLQSDGTHYGEW